MKEDKYYIDLEKEGYFKTLDKRSKEYREYKQWKKHINLSWQNIESNVKEKSTIGLGDVVETITKATGIKKIVEAITDDCGCDERKKKLNKIPLFRKHKVNCIEKDDYVWVKEIIRKKPSKFDFDTRQRIVNVYNHVFRTNVKITKCYPCIKGYLENLQKYLEVYES